MLEKLAALEEAARLSKEEARKSKIAGQVANVRSAGNKRSVGKLMEIKYICDDMDELWVKLGKKAELDEVRVATATNLDKVNDAIEAQAVKLAELREVVSKELGMYAVAGVSAFGWQLVTSMEKNPDLDKEIHGWDMDEVKANEKKLVQYNRDIATARGGNSILTYLYLILFGRQKWRGARRQEVPEPRGGGGGGPQPSLQEG